MSITYERLMQIAFERQKPTLEEIRTLDSDPDARQTLFELMDLRDLVNEVDENDADDTDIHTFYSSLERSQSTPALSEALYTAFSDEVTNPQRVFTLKRVTRPANERPMSIALHSTAPAIDKTEPPIAAWNIMIPMAELGESNLLTGITAFCMDVELFRNGSLQISFQGETRHSYGYECSVELRSAQSGKPIAAGQVTCGADEFDPVVLVLPPDVQPSEDDELRIAYSSTPPLGDIRVAFVCQFSGHHDA